MTLSEVTKTARAVSGLSLSEASAACGISRAHLWDIESGKVTNPAVKTLVHIAVGLRASPTEFFLAAERQAMLDVPVDKQTDFWRLSQLAENDRSILRKQKHSFRPHWFHPQYCQECGYHEHERLMHHPKASQAQSQVTGKARAKRSRPNQNTTPQGEES